MHSTCIKFINTNIMHVINNNIINVNYPTNYPYLIKIYREFLILGQLYWSRFRKVFPSTKEMF